MEDSTEEEPLTINDIPWALLVSILGKLDECNDLANAACVNRAFRDAIGNEDYVWENAFSVRLRAPVQIR